MGLQPSLARTPKRTRAHPRARSDRTLSRAPLELGRALTRFSEMFVDMLTYVLTVRRRSLS
eukprot:9481052-Pyramimonas_sp.AAC.1